MKILRFLAINLIVFSGLNLIKQWWPDVQWGICGIYSIFTLFLIAYTIIFHDILTFANIPFIIGAVCNCTVVFANHGRMPTIDGKDGTVWIPMTSDTHLNFLGDRFGGCSIGDFFIFAGIAIYLVVTIIQSRKEKSIQLSGVK